MNTGMAILITWALTGLTYVTMATLEGVRTGPVAISLFVSMILVGIFLYILGVMEVQE